MTISEFQRGLKRVERECSGLKMIECDERKLEFCRSVFEECKATMDDRELDMMLDDYLDCLPFEQNEENEEVVCLREEVCHRLAEKSFQHYGAKWADALSHCVDVEDPSSLGMQEKCIEIYERLKRDYGLDTDYHLEERYHHTAMFCDLHGMYEKVVEYTNKELELSWKFNRLGVDNLFGIGMSYQRIGRSYKELGVYDQAKESVTKAIEIYNQLMQVEPESTDCFECFIKACRDLLNEIEGLNNK